MSNIKPDSIIALLDAPEHVKAVLDTSIWVAGRVNAPIGLLHSTPSSHHKDAINYSGTLGLNDEDKILQDFAKEEYQANQNIKNAGKALLEQAKEYCNEHFCKQETYPIHRQCSITESINYIHDKAKLIITGPDLTSKTTLANAIRPSHCPILVTSAPFKTPESALLAFDDKQACHRLVEWVSQSPSTRNMCIHIVMVAKDTPQNNDALQDAYAKLIQAGIKCKKKLLDCRDITSALLFYQQEHKLDMLMSGAFGQSRVKKLLLGSETEKLLDSNQTLYLLLPKHT